ncbi:MULTISPECIES: hypothetical protein [Pseudoalteromonas]|uniref:Outer membrane protein beta-barrel domain-containing protein n=1 Tax=Pseudoalteromonas luteoviolacea (strain 2ta16) TaxID=1353533 RepID=V4HJX6_PSEL2|nr:MULTISPECIES: hypothetical protein [Pseudoalteromonas]ESP91125.1 hypothetical protein PL2TA16_01132 [Pseudoalteromonas luteoviolacea 2ta16]KZN41342.1 hypothetical protein N483_15715 [Pseudoalteromonas luteoviolacea NCIMB 1944]MCG7550181.1 hypothetical protein [Pseudoalteromonas sp. Of7M-16]
MKLLALALSSALISTATFASDTFNFDYVGAGYAKFKLKEEDGDVSLNGFTVEASKQLSENWVISAQYLDTSKDMAKSSVEKYSNGTYSTHLEFNNDIAQWNINTAYIIPLENNALLEFVGSIGRINMDNDTFIEQTIDFSETHGEERSPLHDQWSYGSQYHSSTYGIEANYHIALLDNLRASAGLGYQRIKEADDKNELVYQFELAYDITNDFTISATYRNVDVYENHFVTVRYNF